jgi:alanyl-tRNA synthetase
MRYLTIGALALVLALGVLVGCAPKEEEVAEPTMTLDDCKAELATFMDGVNESMDAVMSDETITSPEEGYAMLLEVVQEKKGELETMAEEFKANVGELVGALAALEEAYSADFGAMTEEDMATWKADHTAAMEIVESVADYCGAEMGAEEEVVEEGTGEEEGLEGMEEEAPAKEMPVEEGGE